nr:hypothetical protein BaRGS_017481 [Batillaria attramentaria]
MALTDTTRTAQDLTIARRLVSIAVSDFLCWFPIGVLGLLSSQGISVSSEANVSMAIIVLPFNSVLKPVPLQPEHYSGTKTTCKRGKSC